jgi:hypothetical protein
MSHFNFAATYHNQAVGPIFRPARFAFGKNRTRSLRHECKYIAALSHATDSNTLSIAIKAKQLSCHQSLALTTSKLALKPASDEVNHLQPVPSIQGSLGPTGSRNDLPITLNRHPVTLQPKLSD